MSFTEEEKKKIFSSLAVIEHELKGIVPSVKKNSRFRLMSIGVILGVSTLGGFKYVSDKIFREPKQYKEQPITKEKIQ